MSLEDAYFKLRHYQKCGMAAPKGSAERNEWIRIKREVEDLIKKTLSTGMVSASR
jgi:hypothetical protein